MQQPQSRSLSVENFHAFLRSIAETVETIFIERACLYALLLETGRYGPSEIDKAIDHAKENPVYQTAARTQFAEAWKTLDEMGKAALRELQLQRPSTGKPN